MGHKLAKLQQNGLFLVLFSIFCLSLAPFLIKIGLNENIRPLPLLTFRLLVSALVFWGIYLFFRPELLRIDLSGLLSCALVAGANALSLFCYYVALTYINVSIAHIIFSLFPVITLLMLALYGEPLTYLQLFRLILAIFGVYLLIGPGGEVELWGVILVLITAVSYALHLNLVQWTLHAYSTQTITIYILTLMAFMLSFFYLFSADFSVQDWMAFSGVGWMVILVTGLVSTALARLAMFAGIQRIGSGQTALLGPIETFLSVLWAVLFLGERLSLIQWLGGVLILLSAFLVMKRKK